MYVLASGQSHFILAAMGRIINVIAYKDLMDTQHQLSVGGAKSYLRILNMGLFFFCFTAA